MKKLYGALLILSAAGTHQAYGTILEALDTIYKQPVTYGENNVWAGVEIVNKAIDPIWVIVKNGDSYTRLTEVAGTSKGTRTTVRWNTDISKPTLLAFWYRHPLREPVFTKSGLLGLTGKEMFDPISDKLYTFTPNKTVYVTWDDKKVLRPETGPLKGWAGKTDSNLSLSKNVVQADIQDITPQLSPW